jgi:hypothetical protein
MKYHAGQLQEQYKMEAMSELGSQCAPDSLGGDKNKNKQIIARNNTISDSLPQN